jgi:uncharacterized protein YcbX
MLGEELATAFVGEHGLFGDRAYALLDKTTGKVASAKSPRKWGRLLDCKAALGDNSGPHKNTPEVFISLPGGELIRSSQPDCDERLSSWLGRPVELSAKYPENTQTLSYEVYWPEIEGLALQNAITESPISQGAAPGTFFNYAPLHLVTTAALRKLRALSPESIFVAQRFRPNIVVETSEDEPDFIENNWIGHTLTIGSEVQLQVTIGCPRCVVTTLPQSGETLAKDEKILRTVVQHNRIDLGPYGVQACLGVYANIIKGGSIRRGDKIVISQ